MEHLLAGILEWTPIWPTAHGHVAGLAGLIAIRSVRFSKATIASALVTSGMLTALIGFHAGYVDPPIGGLVVAGLSFFGLAASFFLRIGLLAVQEGRSPDVMDGFVSGLAQGLSSIGYGGSGLSFILLTASGVAVRDSILLSSISGLPLVLLQVFRGIIGPFIILHILEAALIVVLLSSWRGRPSSLGAIGSALCMANLYQISTVLERADQYAKIMERVSSLVRRYGSIGLLAAMALQAIISPIPADAILVAAGALGMSPLEVGIYGGIGITVGSIVNYLIARAVGRRILEHYMRKDLLERIYHWFNKWGGWIVFVTRLVPFLPLDVVSYVAGSVGMKFVTFVLANALAIIPRAAFFGYLGSRIAAGDWILLLLSVALVLFGAYLFSVYFVRGREEGLSRVK